MRFNKLAIVALVWGLIASVVMVPSFYSLVIVDFFKGTLTDPGLAIMFTLMVVVSLGSCFSSITILFRDAAKVGVKSTVALYGMIGMTTLVSVLYASLIFAGIQY